MGIREKINGSPKAVVAAMGVLVVASAGFAIFQAPRGSGPRPVTEGLAYYSTDDGKTWFADAVTRPSPFAKDGKTAYRVYVWRCADGKRFVSHLQRDARLSKPLPAGVTGDELKGPPGGTPARELEVKRPGEANWTKADTTRGADVATPRCPGGGTDGLEPVEP